MLRGNAIAKVDGKGRVKVPALFRPLLESDFGPDFFVTSLRGDSVRVYPMGVWREIEARLSSQSALRPSVMKFRNWTNYFGQQAAIDGQGRFLIHPLVRERAEIDGECAVLGQGNYLEIWNHERFRDVLDGRPWTGSRPGPFSRGLRYLLAALGYMNPHARCNDHRAACGCQPQQCGNKGVSWRHHGRDE